MTVRIQVIKVYDIDVPDRCQDTITYAQTLQTTEIEDAGRPVDAMTDNAEVVNDGDELEPA